MLAYTGRREEAVRHGRLGLEGSIAAGDAPQIAYARILLARIQLAFGDLDAATGMLEEMVKFPHQYSPAWMRLDPMFEPLKGFPRFEAMLRGMDRLG